MNRTHGLSKTLDGKPSAVLEDFSDMSKLEASLLLHIRANELPEPEREYRFHTKRRWRFDLAYPVKRLAIEIEGGIYMQTSTGRSKGHANPKRFEQDCEKYNEAICAGWRVLRVTADQIHDGSAIDWLRRLMFEQGAEVAPF